MRVFAIGSSVKSVNKLNPVTKNYLITKELKMVDKPIIANLKSCYTSAEEKLNDILLERIKLRYPTDVVQHNLDAYERLPRAIKDCLKPSDVNRNGHISQDRINQLWEAAKDAHKSGVYGRPPVFRGLFEKEPALFEHSETVPDLLIAKENLDIVSDVADAVEEATDTLEAFSEVTQEIHESGASLLERLAEFFG